MAVQVKEPIERTQAVEPSDPLCPSYIWHPSFERTGAETTYSTNYVVPPVEPPRNTLSDAVSKEVLKRMNYAGYRASQRVSFVERDRWKMAYVTFRNAAVLGNLTAVPFVLRKKPLWLRERFDLTSQCNLYLLTSLCRFNPWRTNKVWVYLASGVDLCCLGHVESQFRRHKAKHIDFQRAMFIDAEQRDDLDMGEMRALHDALEKCISARQRRVLERQFGLNGVPRDPDAVIAREMEVCMGTVKKTSAAAIKILRRELEPLMG